jgi:hypothetical protein
MKSFHVLFKKKAIIPGNPQMGLYLSHFPNVTTWTTGFIKTIILFSEQQLKICHFHIQG